MVERGEQADVRQQHAVAEHVAGHVADADAGEVLRLRVAAQRAEVALDRFPGAAGGDAHALVVVADRTAGGERIVQPEAMHRGAMPLAMSENVAVPLSAATTRYGSSPSWRTTSAGGTMRPPSTMLSVMSSRPLMKRLQQATPSANCASRFAAGRRCLHEEAALGADRHDDGVLHHLRLDQAQHLGAEVLAASDQRRPPRATGPKRRCTPSTRGP